MSVSREAERGVASLVVPGGEQAGAGARVVGWLTTTDHKVIGYMYITTSFGFFLIGESWR